MDLDTYLTENFDEILDNPDNYVSSHNTTKLFNKKVSINELNNNIIKIEKNAYNKDLTEFDDLDEKEYMDYNYEYYDNSNDYYDIDYEDNYENDNEDDNNSDNDNLSINVNYDNNQNYNNNQIDENHNEDDCTDDIIDELYEKMHNTMQDKLKTEQPFNNLNSIGEEDENDDGYYFFNLINVFIKYYNNKYDKIEHFFSNINNLENDTTGQMELFFDAIIEHKMMTEQMQLSNDEAMKQIYSESEPEKISLMFEKWNKQIYMFELGEFKLFSPSLIVCLNYIFENNILNLGWNIYNLRDN